MVTINIQTFKYFMILAYVLIGIKNSDQIQIISLTLYEKNILSNLKWRINCSKM